MGALAPVSEHAGPSAQAPGVTNFSVQVPGEDKKVENISDQFSCYFSRF
jgi:hypothetical protein